MRGRISLAPEILGGLHQAHAENLLPHAVDGHARGERLVLAEKPAGEAQAVARQGGGHGRQRLGRVGLNPIPLLVVGAAVKNVCERLLIRAFLHH